MPHLTTVTVGTDGNIDYVETPDGTRYALGTMSVLKLVAKLVSSTRHRRHALDLFNKEGQAVVLLDLDAMFDLLAPKRARWSSVSSVTPLIPRADRAASPQGKNMSTSAFNAKLAFIEQQVAVLNKGPAPEALRNLLAAVASISLPNFGDQSKNDSHMHQGQPKVDTVEDPGAYTPPPAVTHPLGKSASFATFQANVQTANEILTNVGETDEKIDSLVTAGRKFNASKARDDLHSVVAQVTDMLSQVDLAQPWVTEDLQKLATRASEIHALFASATV